MEVEEIFDFFEANRVVAGVRGLTQTDVSAVVDGDNQPVTLQGECCAVPIRVGTPKAPTIF